MAKNSSVVSFDPLLNKIKKATTTQVLYTVILVLVLAVGYLFGKVQTLESGITPSQNTVQSQEGNSVFGTQDNAQAAEEEPFIAENLEVGHLPPKGDENAPITIVEFSDFECPFCARFYSDTLSQLESEYIDTGKAKLYYRHYPLSFHPAANKLAVASECANEQGKFWEMHDIIFENQQAGDFEDKTIENWAQELGLNTSEFTSCMDSGKYDELIQEELAAGDVAGVDGTPSFFINGERIVGAQPFQAFKALIDNKLEE